MAWMGLVAVMVATIALIVIKGMRRRSSDAGSVSMHWVQAHRADAS